MSFRPRLSTLLLCHVFAASGSADPWPLILRDGDRVVLIGNALIEQEQRQGYWETMLTRSFPMRNVTFRNLGWSGDTVWGDAQAGFGSASDGFQHLKEHVFALKPTCILAGYGGNESFAGKAALANFREGLNTLLDSLAPLKSRIILLAPLPQEDSGPPLPDPAKHNQELRDYAQAMREIARQRNLGFVDLFDPVLGEPKASEHARLTDDSIHLTPPGYWHTASVLEGGLGLGNENWRVVLGASGKVISAHGAKVTEHGAHPLCCKVIDSALPNPPMPGANREGELPRPPQRVLRVRGLRLGNYTLRIDGKVVATAPAWAWTRGVRLEQGPEFDQVERLRETIKEKNLLYFHRWRPQNETYLFGFRKYEQGQNAREIPAFDPLVAQKEAEIARLRTPVSHRYELSCSPPACKP